MHTVRALAQSGTTVASDQYMFAEKVTKRGDLAITEPMRRLIDKALTRSLTRTRSPS